MHVFLISFVNHTKPFYWRMDLELLPEMATGSYQCRAGNVNSGTQTKTLIFFDKEYS